MAFSQTVVDAGSIKQNWGDHMFDKTKPYNDLSPITQLNIEDTKYLRDLAEETRVAIEILNYAVKSLPSADLILDTLALQEAKVSSHIENIITTNDDLYRGVAFDSYTAEAKEVSNYKDALFIGFNRYKEREVFSLGDIEAINEPVNKKQRGIRTNLPNFENDLTHIANIGADGAKEIIYTPPHGKELLISLLIDMLEFIYQDEQYTLHPLIKIALAHYQFECIHPFRDGNGRTGRILNILFLCQKGYLSYPVLYASSYIIKNKNYYYSLLQTCKESGEYEPIIEYMLNSFKTTAQQTLKVVEEIKEMHSYYTSEDFISELKGQKEVLRPIMDRIFKKVYIRISDLVAMGVHRQTASNYLQQMTDKGLLSEEKVGKEKLFKNIKLLELFERVDKE